MKNLIFVTLLSVISITLFAQAGWVRKADFAGVPRSDGSSFALDTDGDGIDDMGFYVAGWDLNTNIDRNDMWAYDPVADTWTQKASLPGQARRIATSFVIDNIAYVGCGAYTTAPGNYLNDFYAYDPITDTWTQVSSLPGSTRWGAVGFSIYGKGYVAVGSSNSASSSANLKELYEYDPQTDTWTRKSDFPSTARRAGIAFSVDTDGNGVPDKGYIAFGSTNTSTRYNDIWEYDQITDTWTEMSPSAMGAVNQPNGVVIGDEIIVGMGTFVNAQLNDELWRYSATTDSWTFETLFPDTLSQASGCFAINGKMYITCGRSGSNMPRYTYEYTPLTSYSTICGNIYLDTDSNCINTPGTDEAMDGMFVQANPGPYYGITDSAGNYCIKVPAGNFTVSQVIPTSLAGTINVGCPAGNMDTVLVDSLGMQIDSVDFANNLPDCPVLEVSVSSSVRRLCFDNLYSGIQYCNLGYGDADNVVISYEPSPYISVIGATVPYTVDALGVLHFNLGLVPADTCGTITVYEEMTCDTNTLGLLSCNYAQISTTTPSCNAPAPWSGGSLEVSVNCSGGDGVEITITNVGPGDMSDSTDFSVYADSLLRYSGQVMLDSGEAYSIRVSAAGQSIIVSANQEIGYPGGPFVIDWAEACGQDSLLRVSSGFVDDYPIIPTALDEDMFCDLTVAAYDPNDKLVSPQGIGEEHLVQPGTELTYTIRFQNTGTDTAFKVVIVDTLSEHLDISTFRTIGSSHNYVVEVKGLQKPVISFVFNNILLPDSNVNEPASNGYISFKIKPKNSTPLETLISNFADIYFDFNVPVRTEPVSILISNRREEQLDGIIVDGELILGDTTYINSPEKEELHINLYPNPNNGSFNLKVDEGMTGLANVILFDVTGNEIASQRYDLTNSKLIRFEYPHLEKGVYLLQVDNQEYSGITRFVITE